MTATTVGGIVEAKCGKCNDITGHVIMALVGGSIVKVECRACGSTHKYRPADKTGPVRAEPTVRRGRDGTIIHSAPPAPVPGTSGRAANASRPKEPRPDALYAQWRTALRRREAETPLPYAPAGSFFENSLVEHSAFGLGLVLALIPPDKMDVLFEHGIKRLKRGL